MQLVSEKDIEELRVLGNGAMKFIPQAGGGTWRLSYLNGTFRVDKFPEGVKLPVPARRGGGGAIPLPSET